ncbi:MAG TPA: trypsin-like serine protease [Bryobacteraceae bacterium]|nr:trypsin-like serine protease [Bryobacteraceae bacterium]
MSKTAMSFVKVGRTHLSAMLAFAALGSICVGQATAQVKSINGFTMINVPDAGPPLSGVDFVKAKPLPLPVGFTTDATQSLLSALTAPHAAGTPGYSAGGQGVGTQSPVFLGAPETGTEDGFASQDFGTSNHPFSTARADLNGLATNRSYPYSAAGKLFFNIGSGSFICSASMIKRGIVVTAAHCVANYGRSQFYSNWRFVPGYRGGSAPFGVQTVRQAWIKTAYFNGTDGCAQFGVVCPDDVAVLILNPTGSTYVGTFTGWFGYGWNGYGFTRTITEITQLGYPAGLDSASLMERDDSYGYTNSSLSNNTVIGSNMNGGSSGGPWVVNFGIAPTLTGETNGGAPSPNIVVGVTSWGSTSTSPKEMGASPFTTNNIVSLVGSACGSVPSACL